MNVQATDFVGGPAVAGGIESPFCKGCGTQTSNAAFCRACAFRLIEAATADGSPDDHDTPRHYAHYELCLSEAGVPWELGRGAMGVTYKAIDTHLGCPVALKVIHTRRFAEAPVRTRLMREARAAALLRHANIASIFHLGTDEDHCFYAMEFIDGETLEEYVRRMGPLDSLAALQIVAQIARALQEAHGQNFIHRDIKPGNVMLAGARDGSGEEPLVKLIDFGLVKATSDGRDADDHETVGYFAGTPVYASPEQLDRGTVGVESDIYSLGRCLRFMLTGRPLADGEFVTGRVFPAPLLALVDRMTSADPDRRPQTATALLAEVERCRQDLTPRSAPENIRRPGWLLLLSLVVLGGMITLVLLAVRGDRPPAHSPAARAASEKARLLYFQGREAMRQRTTADSQKAVELLLQAVATDPEFADAYAVLGNAYFQRVARFGAPVEGIDQAVIALQHAVAIDPKSADAYSVLGAIRSWQGQHWEALDQLHRSLEIDPTNVDAMHNFSLLWCCVGQSQRALPWAQAATERSPSNVGAWIAVYEACADLGDDARAESSCRRCLDINPVFVDARCGLMHLHMLHGDFDQADEEYRIIASVHDPEALMPLTLKAQLELFRGNGAAAAPLYRRLLAKHRHGLVSYYGGISYLSALGYLCQRAGDPGEGQALLQEAAEMHATGAEGPQGIYDLAAVRAIQGRLDEALSLLRQAINAGWLDHRSTRLDPRFDAIHGEPRFTAMMDEVAARVDTLRLQAELLCAKPVLVADYPITPPTK